MNICLLKMKENACTQEISYYYQITKGVSTYIKINRRKNEDI